MEKLLNSPTITVGEAAELLGISKAGAYAAIHAGTFPVKVIQIGSRYVIPTAPMKKLLGIN